MSNSQSTHLNFDAESGHHGENNNMAPSNDVPHVDPNGVPVVDPVDSNSQVSININLLTDPKKITFAGHPGYQLEKHPKGKVMGLACG